jgi:hypothetical protein
MAHCSNAGYATFAMELEVNGDIRRYGKIEPYDGIKTIVFNHMPFKFGDAVRERGGVLNHPDLWNIVLEKHPNLTLCLAHFGGESDEWRSLIAELVSNPDYPNAYTDLSCMTNGERLKRVKKNFFDVNDISDKIMYGSDFYLNMITGGIKFSQYYQHFEKTFSRAQLDKLCIEVPERYLGIE